jgi:hypothetical protein
VIEIIVASVSACFLGSLWFAKKMVERADRLDGAPTRPVNERRQALRRMRETANADFQRAPGGSTSERLAKERMNKIDQEMVTLDDEEIQQLRGHS